MVLPWPILIALAFFSGAIAWAAWVILRDRDWPYADEPLWARLSYLALFSFVMVGIAVWLILSRATIPN